MGAVFLAYDPHAAAEEELQASAEGRDIDKDNFLVAVKVIQQRGSRNLPEPQQKTQRKLLKDAFQNEIAAARMVSRYRRLFVAAKGHDDLDPAYLAMEYIHQGPPRFAGDVPWQTLSARLGKGQGQTVTPLPLVQVAQIGIAILHGVGAMAQHNIVHNDLKPDNIFTRRITVGSEHKHEIKIMDLGVWTLDQAAAETESVLYGVGDVRGGTADYMSPEQTAIFADAPKDRRLITRRSDLHAVSSVLWELATGRVPYPSARGAKGGGHANAYTERLARLGSPPERPPSMPQELYAILAKGLAKEPSERWTDAYEMRERLKRFIDESLVSIDEIERSLAAMKRELEPLNSLIQRLTQLDVRVRSLKQGRREANEVAAFYDAESLVGEAHTIREEIATAAAALSNTEVRRRSDARAATQSASSKRLPPLSDEPSTPPEAKSAITSPPGSTTSNVGALDTNVVDRLVPKKRSPWLPITIATLVIATAAAIFYARQMKGPMLASAEPEPEPPTATPPPSQGTVVLESARDTVLDIQPTTEANRPAASTSVAPNALPKQPSTEKKAVVAEPPPDASSKQDTKPAQSRSRSAIIQEELTAALNNAASKATSCGSGNGPIRMVNVSVIVSPEGRVSGINMDPSSLSPQVSACIEGHFRAIKIQPVGGAAVTASSGVSIQ